MKFKKVTDYNDEKLELLTEVSLYRAVKEHDKDGYVIISASRQDCIDKDNPSAKEIWDENNKRAKNLKTDIANLSYSYVPVYGGYKEEGGNTASIEKSFIVFSYDFRKKVLVDFDIFEKELINLGKKYNQDTILIKRPNRMPKYFYLNTSTWDDIEFGHLKLNDITPQYFTALKGWADTGLNKNRKDNWEGTPKRFTYSESYINIPPQTIMSAHARQAEGELFSMEHFQKSRIK